MEILDLYNRDGIKLSKTYMRGSDIERNENEYIIAVDIWIKNDNDEILMTQRHPSKKVHPLKWECTSGCILAGEDSFTGALREVKEETGIVLKREEGTKIHRIVQDNIKIIFDIFLFRKNVDIRETKIQEEEIINIKWVRKDEMKKMFEKKEIVEPLVYIRELIEKNIV